MTATTKVKYLNFDKALDQNQNEIKEINSLINIMFFSQKSKIQKLEYFSCYVNLGILKKSSNQHISSTCFIYILFYKFTMALFLE